MTVDPKQKVPNPPGVPTKRVVVKYPVGYGRYGDYEKGDELELTEADWGHIGIWFQEVGRPFTNNTAGYKAGKDPVVAATFAAQKKKSKRIRGRLAETNIKDGDA